MAHTKVTKNGTQNTGTANTFSYSGSFNVFKASEVEVELDNVALTFTTSTINESASPREYTVDFTNKEVHIGGANLASSNSVVIQPVTDMGAPTPRATYAPGASVTSDDLNNNQLQLMRKAMEYDEQKLSSRGGTMTGNLHLAKNIDITFEGDTDNNFETTLTVADPTSDKTITFPDTTGTVVTTGDTGTVATGMVADSAITTAKIAADAVTAAKIGDDVINSEHYAAGSIDTEHIGNAQITSVKILDGNVLTSKINDGAVTNIKLADDSVDSRNYVDNSIDTQHIADNQITSAKILDGNVLTSKINDGAVTTVKLADTSVTSGKLANNIDIAGTLDVTGATTFDANVLLAADNQVFTIANGSSSTKFQVDTDNGNTTIQGGLNVQGGLTVVGATTLANQSIGTDEIANDAVTNAKIADDSIDSEHYVDGSIDSAHIGGAQIIAAKLASNSVTESKITDANVTTNKIANDAVTIGKLGCEQTTISDSDSHIPTSGAVVDYVAAQIAPIGGLEVIATDAAFPNTQPASGVVISIADAGGLVVNGSGTSTTGRTVGGSTVTINNINSAFNSSTVDAGVSFMVSSTGSSQTYNFHKATLKESDILNLSNDINDFGNRYRVFAGEPSSNNDEGDLVYDTNANKMKVYDTSTSAWKEVTSTGDFKYLFLCPAGGSGAPTLNGSIATYDLRESSNSGSAASVTNAAQLIVSINGVVQKANTGTSAPAEGFALVDANTIVFGANLASGDSVFIVQIGSAVTIPTPGDGTVSAAKIASGAVETAKIADDAVTGDKIADNLDIPDSNKIRFGTGNDLEVFHDATNSWVDNNTGDLYIRNKATNEHIFVQAGAGGNVYLRPNYGESGVAVMNNGGVELYYDNTKRAETYSNGFKVGNVTIDSTTGGSIFGSDSSRGGIHLSVNAVLPSNSTGAVPDNTISLGSGSARWSNVYAGAFHGDGSNLTGVSSVGGATGVSFNDNITAKFGTDDDLIIYADTNAKMQADNGDFIIQGNASNDILIDPKNNERGIVVKPDAGVELYHDNTKNFETVNGGVGIGINAQMNGSRCSIAQDGTHLSLRSFATGGYDSIIFRSANTTVGKVHFNSGGTQYHTSSDYRRKENIVDLTGAIDRVKTLQPKRFNFKTETDVTRDGFLAHEVTAVPEAILGTKDQVATEKDVEDGKAEAVGDPIYQTIDQSALVPLLSAALKEAIAKIETLETKVAALEAA